ncbi:MAG TPA: S53 family peptidase [Rhizomicrobium sp.]|nr:S53 family peptidase [Rhizomicrobium sp.]
MADATVILPGSDRTEPPGTSIGAPDPQTRIEVSLYVRDTGVCPASRHEAHAARATRLKPVFQEVQAFAKARGLTVELEDPARRLIKLSGELGPLERAFGTTLQHYEHLGQIFRGRRGTLSIPANLAGKVESVLGLDTRPAATPKIVFPRTPSTAASFKPNEIATLYGFPIVPSGTRQCIGLIELGGGYRDSDTATAFAAMRLPVPAVIAVPVSGGANTPGGDADGEVALDIQVAGGAAPGCRIAVYFAPNTDQGFVDAITTAVHDQANMPSALSISWGSAESSWTGQAVATMNAALSDAAQLGVTVTAASGDGLATDGVSDGLAHVDFPASSPFALGCGGTRVTGRGGTIATETVWNSEGSGTGGGVSGLFPLPDYQKDAKVGVSVSTKEPGRGVPDVAADADPNTGYSVVIDGQTQSIGGTSAAAPLWAAFFALLNELRDKPVGQPHATLYANAAALRDITEGDNKSGSIGYTARAGWDACTGLGSPIGGALTKVFAAS